MKLYYAPGACSMASRIAFHEAGIAADYERVDLKTKRTEYDEDFLAINPKGYVPMLVLDDGAEVTENVAILSLLADREPALGPDGPLARTRLIEMLAYLSGEVHVAFKPLWHGGSDSAKVAAREAVASRLDFLAEHMAGPWLFGERFTVADAYLVVMLRWAVAFAVPLPSDMLDYFGRALARDSVRQALAEEGLSEPVAAAPVQPMATA